MGGAGHLLRSADRERQELYTAADRDDGSARQEPAAALQQQFALSKRLYDAIVSIQEILPRVNEARDRARASGNAEVADRLSALVGAGGGRGGRGRGAGGGPVSLAGLSAQLSGLYALSQEGSGPVPVQTSKAAEAALAQVQSMMSQARELVPGTSR